jgi:REP element-mobilizing transposase RayT
MPVKRKIPFDNGHFFITFTCYKWLQLFAKTDSYDLVYKWFDLLKKQGHIITGFVIMPNHIHATIAFRKTTKSINTIIGDGKRFIGYGIVDRLEKFGLHDLLEQLKNGVNKSDKKRGKIHEVWEESFDWKECVSDEFTWQKLDYMHENPCVGRWCLADNAAAYLHSSARFYLSGTHAGYAVLNFKELSDINLITHSG